MINTTIGKYKITRLIGEGGMASVYEAEHELLGTKVAIKVLNPILSANTQIRERFKNEAKVMASLNHPNITRVIDFDEQPQHLSIVMEYLEGEDLSQKIKKNGALSDKQIIEVFTQTLSAFQYAHDKGIVHRDIKPSNIFILPDGQVKILDFGIAKLFGQSNEMTQTGTQMGTPTYMSPEQVKADKTIDNRSDIYSLGVTLYCTVNGKTPYNSATESQFDIFNKIVYEPLPEIIGNSKFNNIINKACAKNREERFQNCNAWLSEMNNPSSVHLSTPNSEDKTVIANKVNDDATKLEQPIKNNANSSTQETNEQTSIDNIKQETENKLNPSSNTHSNLPQEKKSKTGLIIGIVTSVVLLVAFIALKRTGEEKLIGLNDKTESLGMFDYYGTVSNGLPDGKGKATYYNGAKYEGEYKNGLREGHGIWTFADSSIYEGEFKNNSFDGHGKWTFASGDIYEGEFKNNYFNGHFKITQKNGEIKEANFISGYPLIEIGNQGWMENNLDVTTYRNGDPIPQVKDPTEWAKLTTGAWCFYNNDPANGAIYGKLYNWYAVNDPRGLAPIGWHVPSDGEWDTLTIFLGGADVAGDKLKAVSSLWQSTGNATNSSSFAGLPGGDRFYDGSFYNVGFNSYWWSATEYDTTDAWYRCLFYNNSNLGFYGISKTGGLSVRCVRDWD